MSIFSSLILPSGALSVVGISDVRCGAHILAKTKVRTFVANSPHQLAYLGITRKCHLLESKTSNVYMEHNSGHNFDQGGPPPILMCSQCNLDQTFW